MWLLCDYYVIVGYSTSYAPIKINFAIPFFCRTFAPLIIEISANYLIINL